MATKGQTGVSKRKGGETKVGAKKGGAKKGGARARSKLSIPKRNVVPDRVDLRDRPYMPPVAMIPGAEYRPKIEIPVLNQGDLGACTGFALASVVYHLLRKGGRKAQECKVSPYMLYSMARRYDEFPGSPEIDTGSSLRGAMKGWYKHGVCGSDLWKTEKMPTGAVKKASDDWWLEAVNRPLGAYYRIDPRSVTDMQVALHEVGVLYASAACHAGWDEGFDVELSGKGKIWMIPPKKAGSADGGHAFAIVGYTPDGFIIQNSWGTGWGTGGRALLAYEDWLDNAMDCWVAQIGVVTTLHREIAKSTSLRYHDDRVQLATEVSLRMREISPFIINMENNGRLSNTGEFRTQESDVQALVMLHIDKAREAWKIGKHEPIDIALYAHGGLVSEESAAETAAKWIPALYDEKIFPIFLMWETDLFSTLKNRLEDILRGQRRPTRGLFEGIKTWWNERLEKVLAVPGTAVWGEMKQNAEAISSYPQSGGRILYEACMETKLFQDPSKVRLHLIGHSAGAIVHSHIVDRLGGNGWEFASVNFMAPAVRSDLFKATVAKGIVEGTVKRYHQFHLTDTHEQKDPTCRPILGYGRSLLYLVSQSFERGQVTPILGMEKYFQQDVELLKLPQVQLCAAPGKESGSTTHGGFDDDVATMNSVIAQIAGLKGGVFQKSGVVAG